MTGDRARKGRKGLKQEEKIDWTGRKKKLAITTTSKNTICGGARSGRDKAAAMAANEGLGENKLKSDLSKKMPEEEELHKKVRETAPPSLRPVSEIGSRMIVF